MLQFLSYLTFMDDDAADEQGVLVPVVASSSAMQSSTTATTGEYIGLATQNIHRLPYPFHAISTTHRNTDLPRRQLPLASETQLFAFYLYSSGQTSRCTIITRTGKNRS